MINDLCKYLNNYFIHDRSAFHFGVFTIEEGSLGELPFLQDGQYFRIAGSVFNDGVYKYPAAGLKNETFNGAIWAMSVPADFVALAQEIKAWVAQNQTVLDSPYSSESFGGYSYTRAGGYASNGGSGVLSWQTQFEPRLSLYRRAAVFK